MYTSVHSLRSFLHNVISPDTAVLNMASPTSLFLFPIISLEFMFYTLHVPFYIIRVYVFIHIHPKQQHSVGPDPGHIWYMWRDIQLKFQEVCTVYFLPSGGLDNACGTVIHFHWASVVLC